MYDGYYNGSLIFFDTDVTDEARKSILDIENDVLDYSHDVSLEDKYFDTVPDRYKKLIPSIRYEDIKKDFVNDINDATIKFINSIKAIENAVYDYCDGDGIISSENKAILDFYLGQSKSLSNDNDSDNKIIVDQVVSIGNSGEAVELSDDEEISMLGDGIGASLYSTTSLNKEKKDENKNMLNYNNISLAAIAALTGKIIYDKQQEVDDDDDGTNDNDDSQDIYYTVNNVELVKLTNEKHVNDDAKISTNSVDSVEFKNDILDGVIGDD